MCIYSNAYGPSSVSGCVIWINGAIAQDARGGEVGGSIRVTDSSAPSVFLTASNTSLWRRAQISSRPPCLRFLGWERYRERQGARSEWSYRRRED
jgi:hypothetical protein